MIMEVQFRIDKHTQVFNTVGIGYGGMTKFIVEDQCNSLPRERNNSGFTDVQFHKVSSAPTLYGIDVRLKYTTVVWGSNSTKDFDVVNKKKIPGVVNSIAQVVNEYIEKQRPQDRSLRNTRRHNKRR
jgi:hypothetical protein